MDRASHASLGQKGWVSSKRAKPGREVLLGHPSHTADNRDKLVRALFLRVTHDIPCDHPCSCRRELFVQGDIALAPDSMLFDGQQSVVARNQAFSSLRACSRNRKSQPHLSRTKSSSNFASRDATKALLRLERTRAMVSFLRICCHGFPSRCPKARFGFKRNQRRVSATPESPATNRLSPYCTVTSVPTGISEKNLRAASSGNLMQPCDAG